MTLARVAALAALLIAVVVVAVLLLRGDGGMEYTVRLMNAGQLVRGNEVQVGGRSVGSIEEIELTDNNQAQLKIKVEDDFAPLHEGTTATVRATSLSGIANRYLELSPGPQSADALPAGTRLGTEKTTSIVDLDQLFNTLDPKTRRSLQLLIQGFSDQYDGKAQQANEAIKYLNPALSTTDQLIQELLADEPTLERFLVDASSVVSALAERRDDLAGLVRNTNQTASAIADENAALNDTLDVLPGTLRKANTTFVNLRATLDDLTTLVDTTKPVAPELAPFFRRLRPLVNESRPTIRDLSRLIRAPGANNDTIDLLNKTPQLARLTGPVFRNTRRALRQSLPVIKFIRPYSPEFIGWLRDFGQGASNYDANGHFARIQPIVNTFSFTDNQAGGELRPIPNTERLTGYERNVQKRCPGAASQAPPDGSSPFFGGPESNPDCDTSLFPPGP